MARASIKVKGLDKLMKKLARLPKKVANKVTRQAIRAGLKPIAAAAKSNAPSRSGKLKRAVKVKAGKRKKNRISLNAQIGEGSFKGETFYGGFVNFGTSRQEANDFMGRAFEEKGQEGSAIIQRELRDGIVREAKSS